MSKSVTTTLTSYLNCILDPTDENTVKFMQAVNNKEIGDEQGIVYMGLADNHGFSLWKMFGANIPGIRYYFGPIIVITDLKVAEELLRNRKNTEKDNKTKENNNGYCIGNRSSYIIQSQVGKRNLFGVEDSETHRELRILLKNALNNQFEHDLSEKVRSLMIPYIRKWLFELEQLPQFNVREAVNKIISIFFAKIVLGHDPEKVNLNDIIKTVSNFVEGVTNPIKQTMVMPLNYGFNTVGCGHPNIDEGLPKEIEKLGSGCGKEMCLMLEKVGFSNIHSALSSLIYRLATNSEWVRKNIEPELLHCHANNHDDNHDDNMYNYMNIAKTEITLNSRNFFYETMRLAPPVWLQARKVGGDGLKLNSVNQRFPPYSLLLVPNFILARNMRNNDFNPNLVTEEEKRLFNPFSFATSPNTCAGRGLAIPLIEVIMGEIIKNYRIVPVVLEESYKGDVALRFKNDQFARLVRKN